MVRSDANTSAIPYAGCGRTASPSPSSSLCALSVAGLEMIQPLFMRFIVDRVLLVPDLAAATRGRLPRTAGLTFLVVIIVESLLTGLRDYRQRLLNTRVMLSLRRSLYRPLPSPAAAKTVGHEDGRHPVAVDR